ncbi:MAG: lysine 2,3-aminomutase, partial [Fidelibacterota bacterium]
MSRDASPTIAASTSQRNVDVAAELCRFRVYSEKHLDQIVHLQQLSRERRFAMRVVAQILPFRVNQYIIDQLIDWDNIPEDPIFQMTFPQPNMLPNEDFDLMADLLRRRASEERIHAAAHKIRYKLNPHPGGQQDYNVPHLGSRALPGMQHKYSETVLFFPRQGQTCYAYCTFCFRWPQFVGGKELQFTTSNTADLYRYLLAHEEVSDLLITGGDPMIMKTRLLSDYLRPLLRRGFEHIRTIRLGTKSLTYWPQRYFADEDADDL